MVTVLLATIGKRDPVRDGEPTGPLRAALKLRPDIAVLLAGQDVRDQAEATRDAIQGALPACEVHLEFAEQLRPGVPNLVVDIQELLYVGRAVVHRHPELREPASRVAVCFSSGTPQMSVAMTLVARSLIPGAQHYQALDPGNAQPGSELLRTFDPDALVRLDARSRVFEALARGDGAAALAAGEPLRAVHPPPWNKKALESALAVSRALEWVAAYQRQRLLHFRLPQVKGLGEAAADLTAIEDWFKQCQARLEAWGAELAAQALRLAAREETTRAIIAAAVAAEVLVTAALERSGLDPEDIKDPGAVPEELRQDLKASDDQRKYRLEGAQRRSKLLAARDPGYQAALAEGLERQREAIARARNVAVHQGKAPDAGLVAEIQPYLDRLAEVTKAPIPSRLPTAPPSLARLARLLEAAL